jgi:hypothetical protein
MASIGASGLRPIDLDDGVGLLRSGIFGAMLRLDILQSELDLLIADALRTAAVLSTSQHREDMVETLGSRGQAVDLEGRRGCPSFGGLRCYVHGQQQSLQALDIVWSSWIDSDIYWQNR